MVRVLCGAAMAAAIVALAAVTGARAQAPCNKAWACTCASGVSVSKVKAAFDLLYKLSSASGTATASFAHTQFDQFAARSAGDTSTGYFFTAVDGACDDVAASPVAGMESDCTCAGESSLHDDELAPQHALDVVAAAVCATSDEAEQSHAASCLPDETIHACFERTNNDYVFCAVHGLYFDQAPVNLTGAFVQRPAFDALEQRVTDAEAADATLTGLIAALDTRVTANEQLEQRVDDVEATDVTLAGDIAALDSRVSATEAALGSVVPAVQVTVATFAAGGQRQAESATVVAADGTHHTFSFASGAIGGSSGLNHPSTGTICTPKYVVTNTGNFNWGTQFTCSLAVRTYPVPADSNRAANAWSTSIEFRTHTEAILHMRSNNNACEQHLGFSITCHFWNV